MQQVSEQAREALEESVSLELFNRVTMEIELNNYFDYELDFPESLDDDFFPADSVMGSRRPSGGLPKFVIGDARAVSTEIEESSIYPDQQRKIFYRTPNADSKYKYFRTKQRSDESGLFSAPLDMIVVYDSLINLNNIVIGFEYANAIPNSVSIEILQDDEWIQISNDSPDEFGKVNLYYNGSWSNSYSAEYDVTSCRGVRVSVESMSAPSSAVELIQISPRILIDISDRAISTNVNKSRETVELVSPFGVSSASSASFNISNQDNFLDNNNEQSPLFGLIDFNMKFYVKTIIKTKTSQDELNEITCFANTWDFSSEKTVAVECSDRSKILQAENIDDVFYVNKDIRFVVADIIERSGITDYEIRYSEEDAKTRVPFVFFENDFTVWQALQDLAIAEQAVLYFDENDKFIWESRDFVWQEEEVDFTLNSEYNDEKLANLVSYSYTHEVVANKGKVFYAPTDLAKRGDELINNFLWEDDGPTVLLASPLIEPVYDYSNYIVVDNDSYLDFPEEGVVLIDAEYIKYVKKTSEEFDGEDQGDFLYIIERGVYGSGIKQHLNNIDVLYWNIDSAVIVNMGEDDEYVQYEKGQSEKGFFYVDKSKLILNSTIPGESNITRVISGFNGEDSASFNVYGCEIEFPFKDILGPVPFLTEEEQFSAFYDGDGIAGMFVNADDSGAGYYFELVSTLYARKDQIQNREVRVWKYDSNGKRKVLKGYYPEDILGIEIEEYEEILGADIVVAPGIKYKMNVFQESGDVIVDETPVGKYIEFTVTINGKRIFKVRDEEAPGEDIVVWTNGSWGVFARGNTEVSFEYVYAIDRFSSKVNFSRAQLAIRDQINGGYNDFVTEALLTEFSRKRADFFFEDFGSWVRQAIEYDVRHEILPAFSSRLFLSNEDGVFVVYHKKNQFSSKLVIANRAREFTVAAGDSPRDGVKYTLAVYGVPLIQSEMRDIEVVDKKSISIRGINEISVDSRFIQTKQHAQRIANWIVERWADPLDFVAANIVVDPRIQLGDLIAIESPRDNLSSENQKFHVIEIQKNIGEDPSMSLTLRRAYF